MSPGASGEVATIHTLHSELRTVGPSFGLRRARTCVDPPDDLFPELERRGCRFEVTHAWQRVMARRWQPQR